MITASVKAKRVEAAQKEVDRIKTVIVNAKTSLESNVEKLTLAEEVLAHAKATPLKREPITPLVETPETPAETKPVEVHETSAPTAAGIRGKH